MYEGRVNKTCYTVIQKSNTKMQYKLNKNITNIKTKKHSLKHHNKSLLNRKIIKYAIFTAFLTIKTNHFIHFST